MASGFKMAASSSPRGPGCSPPCSAEGTCQLRPYSVCELTVPTAPVCRFQGSGHRCSRSLPKARVPLPDYWCGLRPAPSYSRRVVPTAEGQISALGPRFEEGHRATAGPRDAPKRKWLGPARFLEELERTDMAGGGLFQPQPSTHSRCKT
jgi:hypothetical protein